MEEIRLVAPALVDSTAGKEGGGAWGVLKRLTHVIVYESLVFASYTESNNCTVMCVNAVALAVQLDAFVRHQ